mgnify:CR=1 FL=1
MKRTVWILLAAIAVVAGVYLAADLLGNGMLRGIFVRTVFLYGRIYGYDRYPASVSFSQLVSNQAAAFLLDGTGCCNLYCLRADTKQPCRYEAQGRDRKGDGNGPASVFGGARFLSFGGFGILRHFCCRFEQRNRSSWQCWRSRHVRSMI